MAVMPIESVVERDPPFVDRYDHREEVTRKGEEDRDGEDVSWAELKT